MTSNRSYYHKQAYAAAATRNSQGRFASTSAIPTANDDDNSYYWRDLMGRCRDRLPVGLDWPELTKQLWAAEYIPTHRETANTMAFVTEKWNAGERDLAVLAERVRKA